MSRRRSWNIQELRNEAAKARSFRDLLLRLHLVPAGGNYAQIHKYISENNIDTSHFIGERWSTGMKRPYNPRRPLSEILTVNTNYQSFKLKARLFREGLKHPKCEICGWAQRSPEGYLPLELDHVNGNRLDNRLENLRILCPNCHSLQPTHRGRNKGKAGMVKLYTRST